MKIVALEEAAKEVAELTRSARHEPVVLARGGKPAAVLTDVTGLDWESIALGMDRGLAKVLDERWKRYECRGGKPARDVFAKHGLKFPP